MSIAGAPGQGESHPHTAEHLPPRRNCPADEDIVISGISGRYPESDSLDEFWEKLLSGVELISCNDRRWPIGEFFYFIIFRSVSETPSSENLIFSYRQ